MSGIHSDDEETNIDRAQLSKWSGTQERYHEYMQRMYREEREPQIWTVKIWKDDYDNYVLPIPKEILKKLELNEGDTLKFDDSGNGIFKLTKG